MVAGTGGLIFRIDPQPVKDKPMVINPNTAVSDIFMGTSIVQVVARKRGYSGSAEDGQLYRSGASRETRRGMR